DDFDGLLPHLLLADVVRFVCTGGGATARGSVVAALEDLFRSDDEESRELIAVSFLENLPRENDEGGSIRQELGPLLSDELRRLGA
ncbi:MAG: hypothetical protein GY788_03550, partial [bacterium]|nr:hypothetical protein [bacterium]